MSFGKNYRLFNDLDELEKMVNSLEIYLKGSEVYGSIGGGILTGGNAPQLTVGAILLRLRRIKELRNLLDDKRQARLHAIENKHDEIRHRMRNAYNAKMEREAHSRLDAMKRFFEECREDRGGCKHIYNPEVLRRTTVQELLNVMEPSAELDDKVARTDRQLRNYVTASDFVWDPQLEPIYPRDPFWWMYMSPA